MTLSDCVLRMPFPHTVREKFAELDFRSMISLPIFDENGQIFTEREAESLKIKNIEEVKKLDKNDDRHHASHNQRNALKCYISDIYILFVVK